MHFLDAAAQRQLEFDHIWKQIQPVSPLGKAQHRSAEPYLPEQVQLLAEELERLGKVSVRLGQDPQIADDLLSILSSARDVSHILRKSQQGVSLDDTEFYEVKKLLLIVGKVHAELERCEWTTILPQPLDLCSSLWEALSRGQGGRGSFYLADDYDSELAEVRRERRDWEGKWELFRAQVDEEVAALVGRPLSPDEQITVDRQTAPRLQSIPELVQVAEDSQFITFRLQAAGEAAAIKDSLRQLRAREEACKERVRARLTAVVASHSKRLAVLLQQLGYLDLLLAKARFCVQFQGVKPKLVTESVLRIRDGRHLLVEQAVQAEGQRYSPISLELTEGVTLITGPNMGGKTVSLKTIGLLVAMAQYGLLVPAVSMEFKPRLFIRTHLASTTPKGLSSFAEEVVFLREAIRTSGGEGLVLVDEIAHGTNPAEGAAIAQAVLERLRGQPLFSVVTTHFPSLAQVDGIRHLRVKGLDKERLEKEWDFRPDGRVVALQPFMDYRLEEARPGPDTASDAVIVAQVLGLDPEVIRRAKELQGGMADG